MALSENDSAGCRAVILRLRSPEAQCQVTLLPLIEGVGQGYDEAILRELERQDVILFEPGPTSGIAPHDSIAPRVDLTLQRATLRDAHERDGLSASDEAPAQEFGRWWQGFPVGGGPHTSIALFRTAVMAATWNPRSMGNGLTQADEVRLRRLVLDAPDRSIDAVVDRLYDALKNRALFIAIFLSPRHLEAAAKRLRLHHRLQVIEKTGLPRVGMSSAGKQSAPSGLVSLTAGTCLMDQLAVHRRRTEVLLEVKKAVRLGLAVVAILVIAVFLYYGFTYSTQFEWTGIRKG